MTEPNISFTDGHGRSVSYMRVSVTDRCNLRCRYCGVEGREFIPHPEILRYEELERLIALAPRMGVSKIRFTGGEPLVRKGFTSFVERLLSHNPALDLRITTNATLLDRSRIDRLVTAGVQRVNISLDTLDPERFIQLTGRDFYHRVRTAIDDCLDAGLKVKVNAVALKDVNSDELPDFLEFAKTHSLDFRLIEFMPIGSTTCWKPGGVWTMDEILADARTHAELEPVEAAGDDQGPAKMFNIVGGKGRLGLISPLSHHFCGSCNRLRITSRGNLRTCLFSDREFRLGRALRNPRLTDENILRIMERASRSKPLGHELLKKMLDGQKMQGVCKTEMSAIGG